LEWLNLFNNRQYVVGVVSFKTTDAPCGKGLDKDNVFVRVTTELGWILEQTRGEECSPSKDPGTGPPNGQDPDDNYTNHPLNPNNPENNHNHPNNPENNHNRPNNPENNHNRLNNPENNHNRPNNPENNHNRPNNPENNHNRPINPENNHNRPNNPKNNHNRPNNPENHYNLPPSDIHPNNPGNGGLPGNQGGGPGNGASNPRPFTPARPNNPGNGHRQDSHSPAPPVWRPGHWHRPGDYPGSQETGQFRGANNNQNGGEVSEAEHDRSNKRTFNSGPRSLKVPKKVVLFATYYMSR
jgi:hypothetical protein